jgi:multidrug efflux system membrane fusion protein
VQLTQAEGQLARDRALLENSKLDLERYQTLFEQDSIAKQQVDTQASLVRQYEGAVKADQGLIDNARLQLTYSRVTAPIGGRIGLRQVDPGNVVHASDTTGLVVITQLQPIAVIFSIPEDSLPGVMDKLQAGQRLVVDAYDRAGKTKLATGFLLTVDNQIDSATGTVKLKAQFANDVYHLFPNQFVNVRMLLEVKRNATIIPTAAIQRGTQGTFVYVIQADNTVTIRVIKLGPTEGELAAVDSGLTAGEQVVVDGSDKLREGAKVELAAKDGTAAPAEGSHPKHGGKRRRDGDATAPATTTN